MGLLSKKEIGYLIGLFEGDGYLYHHKKSRHYHIEFFLNSIKDKDIQVFLLSLLKKMNLKPSVMKDKRFNCNKIRVYSKSFFQFVNKMLKYDIGKDFKIGFLSGIIDADGYVSTKSHIEIVNTNKNLMLKVRKFLNDFNLKVKISERTKSRKDKLPSYRIYVPIKFIKLKNISIKVNRSINSGLEQGRNAL